MAGAANSEVGHERRTVFGTTALSETAARDLRVELRSGAQADIVEAAGRKFRNKQQHANELFHKVSGARRQSQAAKAIVKQAKNRRVNSLKRALKYRWVSKWQSARQMIRKLGGMPLVFVHRGASCGDTARTFSGTRSVQSVLFDGQGLAEFARCPDARSRRVILAPSLAQPPLACSIAAILLGGCVQSKLIGHFLRYKKLARHSFACTRGAARKHPELWNLVKAFSEAPDVAKCKIVTVARAAEQLRANLEAKPRSQPWARLTIFVSGPGDAEVEGIRAPKALLTFDQFVKDLGKIAES